MQVDADAINRVSRCVIGCSFRVMNALGVGFLEKVYDNALAHELRKAGLGVVQQHCIEVRYDDVVVGKYVTDMLVDDLVLVELKVVASFSDIHVAQAINYLKATGLPLCLLMNFGHPRVQVKRVVHGAQRFS